MCIINLPCGIFWNAPLGTFIHLLGWSAICSTTCPMTMALNRCLPTPTQFNGSLMCRAVVMENFCFLCFSKSIIVSAFTYFLSCLVVAMFYIHHLVTLKSPCGAVITACRATDIRICQTQFILTAPAQRYTLTRLVSTKKCWFCETH